MCTVMVVEERFTTMNWLCECIRNSNIKSDHIVVCKSGAEALDYISKNNVDIAITRLQKMDNACVDFAKAMRKKRLFSIILGYGTCKDFKFLCEVINSGVSKYLEDVFNKEKLEEFLNEAYERYCINKLQLKTIAKISAGKSEIAYSSKILNEWVEGYSRNTLKNSFKSIDNYTNIIFNIMDNQKLSQSKSMILEIMVIINEKVGNGDFKTDYLMLNSKECCAMMNLHTIDELKEMFQTYINRLSKNIYILTVADNHKSKSIIAACNYIKSNYDKDISRDDVAKAVNLNPSYFSKFFKEQMDESFVAYLRRIRIETAISYLENTADSISTISAKVGYADSKYFSKLFYKHTGYTLCDYRKYIVKLMA